METNQLTEYLREHANAIDIGESEDCAFHAKQLRQAAAELDLLKKRDSIHQDTEANHGDLSVSFIKYGRILVREGREVGVFIPYRGNKLKAGLYEVVETIFGEERLLWVGEPAIDKTHLSGLSPDCILANRELALMTKQERETARTLKRENNP